VKNKYWDLYHKPRLFAALDHPSAKKRWVVGHSRYYEIVTEIEIQRDWDDIVASKTVYVWEDAEKSEIKVFDIPVVVDTQADPDLVQLEIYDEGWKPYKEAINEA
jgi:hypothetical protein